MEQNINETKMYIYNKINNLEINSFILKDYILQNNIKYTKNKNGIFLNLNSLDDNNIINIYNIIINKINYNKLVINNDFKIEDVKIINKVENNEKKEYKVFEDNYFNKIDLKLIQLSLLK
tara:strand:- start:329 stop:688 length:360 start_codon:yes stop_codon:yes gene_type:complete